MAYAPRLKNSQFPTGETGVSISRSSGSFLRETWELQTSVDWLDTLLSYERIDEYLLHL